MAVPNTKFKAGDLVLLGPNEECLIVIERIQKVRLDSDVRYPIHVSGYSYTDNDAGYSDTLILSEKEDRILTDPQEQAYWLLRFENAVKENG